MKRNTMKVLSLMLALVMLLGAVPFAAAATTPSAMIEVYPGKTVWEGTEVELNLVAPSGYTTQNELWEPGQSLNTEMITVTPTTDTTYRVSYELVQGTTVIPAQEASVNLTVLKKATDLTISYEGNAYVGVDLPISSIGGNSSSLEWTVEGDGASVNNGVFKATKTGTYKVTATAVNDTSDDDDDVTSNTLSIVVTEPTYIATMANKTITLGDRSSKMVATAKKGTATVSPTSIVYAVTSGSSVSINSSTGLLTPKAAGISTVKATLTFADNAIAVATATVTVTDSGVIFLEQDGEVTDDDDMELEFSVVGPAKKDEVEWVFEVSALNMKSSESKNYFSFVSKSSSKIEYEVEEDGPEIEVDLYAKKGFGIAVIEAEAYWTGSKQPDATGLFYVSFYDEVDYEVTLKDTVDEFDWDDEDVFSAAKRETKTYTATELKTLNLAELLLLEAGTYIDLDEGKKANKNEDVGEITAGKKLTKWDPDEVNTYEMEDLEYLTFEADDEGTFYIDYVQYDEVYGYDDLVIGEGTLMINVGKGDGSSKEGDINYDVKNKGEVELDEDDFEDYWEDYCDDEDIDDDFGYVVFDYKATAINGTLYGEGGDKSVKSSYYYHFDYDDDEDDSSKDFDLNDMVYEASTSKTNYIDEIDFTCYSEDGREEVDGTLTFTVGTVSDKEETNVGTMSFTDVKSTDWYYEAVKYVYENGIMAGTSTTKFSPDTNLTRGMIVTMLYRVEAQPTPTSTNKFTDVKSGDYYYDAVRWAAANGIVTGTTTTTFSPNTNITRQDLATILYRYVKEYKGQTASLGTLTGFADASQVSDYASSAMKWAVGKGIVNGVGGSLLPKGNATRAQAATMFQRLLAD